MSLLTNISNKNICPLVDFPARGYPCKLSFSFLSDFESVILNFSETNHKGGS